MFVLSRVFKILFLVIVMISLLSLIQSRYPLIVDDVAPNNYCPELLQAADVLYVIPLAENNSITNNSEWCATIRSLHKTIGLHGIRHTYHEFSQEVAPEDLSSAVQAFEQCFGEKPALFRPPYNVISNQNRELVQQFNMTVYNKRFFQHPYCHCQPHSFMKLLNWILFC